FWDRRIYHMGRQCPQEKFNRWSKGKVNNFYNELSLEEQEIIDVYN
ncbi:37770_t:CDS:1, partial [Gigaspora margarita]